MKPETRNLGQVEFVAEQDGEPRRVLKTRLIERFRSSAGRIETYLVSARYGQAAGLKVAPYLRTDTRIPDFQPGESHRGEFAHVFRKQSLEALLLTRVQNQRIVAVAHPVYRPASTGNA